MTTPLISLDDVKVHLPIRAGVTEFDSRLTQLILTASHQIETATEREFAEAARVEIRGTPNTISYGYDFAGTTNDSGLLQRSRPARYSLETVNIDVNTVEVYYDPSGVFGADTLVDSQYVHVDSAKGHITVRHPMARTIDGLKIAYTGGYAVADGTLSDSIPGDLKMAAISQTLFLHTRLNAMNVGRMAEKKEGEGANTFSVPGGLTPEAQALLVRYRPIRMSLD